MGCDTLAPLGFGLARAELDRDLLRQTDRSINLHRNDLELLSLRLDATLQTAEADRDRVTAEKESLRKDGEDVKEQLAELQEMEKALERDRNCVTKENERLKQEIESISFNLSVCQGELRDAYEEERHAVARDYLGFLKAVMKQWTVLRNFMDDRPFKER